MLLLQFIHLNCQINNLTDCSLKFPGHSLLIVDQQEDSIVDRNAVDDIIHPCNGPIDREEHRRREASRFFYGVLDPRFKRAASHECESRCWSVYGKGNRPAIGIYYSTHGARTFLPSWSIPRYTILDASRRQHLLQASCVWAKIDGNSVHDLLLSSCIYVIVDQIRRFLRGRKWNSEANSVAIVCQRVFQEKFPWGWYAGPWKEENCENLWWQVNFTLEYFSYSL